MAENKFFLSIFKGQFSEHIKSKVKELFTTNPILFKVLGDIVLDPKYEKCKNLAEVFHYLITIIEELTKSEVIPHLIDLESYRETKKVISEAQKCAKELEIFDEETKYLLKTEFITRKRFGKETQTDVALEALKVMFLLNPLMVRDETDRNICKEIMGIILMMSRLEREKQGGK